MLQPTFGRAFSHWCAFRNSRLQRVSLVCDMPYTCLQASKSDGCRNHNNNNVLTTSAARRTRRSSYDDALASMMSVCGAAINGMVPPVTAAKAVSGPFNSRMGDKLG